MKALFSIAKRRQSAPSEAETNDPQSLRPLIDRLNTYDKLRVHLEQWGGAWRTVAEMTWLLAKPIPLVGGQGEGEMALNRPSAIRRFLAGLDVHLDIRKRANGLPVYYLCRLAREWGAEYRLIIEDLHVSPDYPMQDERFVRIMNFGHEVYALRLSPFRDRLRDEAGSDAASGAARLDDILCHAGHHVFQAAWHEDQRPGVQTAQHFGLTGFREAVELLYLCLSGELCALRSATDSRLLAFFESVCPHPPILALLQLLGQLDGAALGDLPRRALDQYVCLSAAFRRFLGVEAPWGDDPPVVLPLHKIVFANFSRLDLVARRLQDNPEVQAAAAKLEHEACAAIAHIMDREDWSAHGQTDADGAEKESRSRPAVAVPESR